MFELPVSGKLSDFVMSYELSFQGEVVLKDTFAISEELNSETFPESTKLCHNSPPKWRWHEQPPPKWLAELGSTNGRLVKFVTLSMWVSRGMRTVQLMNKERCSDQIEHDDDWFELYWDSKDLVGGMAEMQVSWHSDEMLINHDPSHQEDLLRAWDLMLSSI